MKLLLVHDRDDVAEQIVALCESLGIGSHEIMRANDGITTREALHGRSFDLVLLDLTIPRIYGKSTADYSAVEDILQELFNSDTLFAPGDLIGITRDVSALDRIDSEIGSHLMTIVEESSDGRWLDQLKDRIKYVSRSLSSRLQSINQNYDYDVAIITALDEEFSPYRTLFELENLDQFPGTSRFLFNDRDQKIRKGVVYSIGRAGPTSAASATQALITQFRPELCLMSGFCGGFSSKVKLGNVIFAESVVDWDSGKWNGTGHTAQFVPRPEPINIRDTKIHRIVRELISDGLRDNDGVLAALGLVSPGAITSVNLKLGPIATGSAVVTDPLIISRIQNLNENILGVDMEAFGMYFAASKAPVVRPHFIAAKAVADYCDINKADNHHMVCSTLSAYVVNDIITQRWSFER